MRVCRLCRALTPPNHHRGSRAGSRQINDGEQRSEREGTTEPRQVVRSGSAAGDKGENVPMNARRLIAALAGAVVLAACTAGGPTGDVTSALPVRAAPAARSHVVVLVMENKEQGQV